MTSELPIRWPDDGLIPAVIQDATRGDVLMVGFMNREALATTRESGFVHFWSRSRGKLWKKGETSGHTQTVHEIRVNCDLNSILIEVHQQGAVCHDGYATCYYRRLEPDNSLEVIRSRWFDPETVYGDKSGLTDLLTQWWGAYQFLRDNDLEAESGTSRAIRNAKASLRTRIADEFLELAGVLDGTHVHTSPEEDIVLEGSQVCYWLAVESIRQGWTFEAVAPDRAMRDISSVDVPRATALASILRDMASRIRARGISPEQAHEAFGLVASAAAAAGVSAAALIEADLRDLESRAYLSPFFAREA